MKKFSFVLFLMAAGCSSPSPQSPPVFTTAPQERAQYELGLKCLSRSDFQSAAKAFSDLLKLYPSTPWLSGAYYNWGLALEGLNQYQEAADKYKKVIELNQPTANSRDEVEGLYRLSICYEALGDDARMTLALLQLKDKHGVLPKQASEMEIPARLAAAYARQGNLSQAKIYYAKAATELKKYRRPPMVGDVMVWLPKTLYSMGSLQPPNKDIKMSEFEDYVSALEESQGWLVRSAELGNNKWSRQSVEKLEDAYLDLVTAIRNFKVADDSDHLLAEKQQQLAQKRMAHRLDQAISKLRLERLPSSPEEPEPGNLTTAFKTIDDVENRITQIEQAHSIEDQDTKEAKAHQSLKGDGQILDKK